MPQIGITMRKRFLKTGLPLLISLLTGFESLAAGGDCKTPGQTLAAPDCSCQLLDGETTPSSPSDFYAVELTAGRSYVFTLCPAACAGAQASFTNLTRCSVIAVAASGSSIPK